jgi:hypothetical protein
MGPRECGSTLQEIRGRKIEKKTEGKKKRKLTWRRN